MRTDDFAQDFKLMIQNAKAFNCDGSAVYVVCTRAVAFRTLLAYILISYVCDLIQIICRF